MLNYLVCLQIIIYFLTSSYEELIYHLIYSYRHPFECEQTNTSPRENRLVVVCPKLLLLSNSVFFFFFLAVFTELLHISAG